MSQSARIMFVIDGEDLSRQGEAEFARYLQQFLRRNFSANPLTGGILLESTVKVTDEMIRAFRPDFICPMGNKSIRHFMGDDADMDTLHSIPVMSRAYNCCVMAIFNPASGMFNSEIQAKCAYGFIHLRMILEGQIGIYESIQDMHPQTKYTVGASKYGAEIVGLDTEGYESDPWMITTSNAPGVGTAVVSNKKWGDAGISRDTKVVMHAAIHDLEVLAKMGITIGDDQFDDTMLMAFCLGVEPQGLKALCLRHCGMRMESFEDVCGTDTDMLAVEWLVGLADWLAPGTPGEDYAQAIPE